MTDALREKFEAWAKRREFDLSPNKTVFADELPFADIETQSHLDAYQAGWQAASEIKAQGREKAARRIAELLQQGSSAPRAMTVDGYWDKIVLEILREELP